MTRLGYWGSFMSLLLLLLVMSLQKEVISAPETCFEVADEPSFVSALGDPGMRDPRARVALEAWNFCNKVGSEGEMPSPRHADCADMKCSSQQGTCNVEQLVSPQDNLLKSGQSFPQGSFTDFPDPDEYAVEKELYLASLCQVQSEFGTPWDFWMIMLKNGNFDTSSGACPSTAPSTAKASRRRSKNMSAKSKGSFPCFGPGCMNQPMIFHNWSEVQMPCVPGTNTSEGDNCTSGQQAALRGSFYGTYDMQGRGLQVTQEAIHANMSYFEVKWEKEAKTGSWKFHHVLRVNKMYPWLMLYLRADATKGESGGYPYETRGMMMKVPESPNFTVKLTLEVIQGGGSASQFYLLDIGGCWKNDGRECDGDVTSDVTRYSEMIINPAIGNGCRRNDVSQCPPYHVEAASGRRIYRNDTAKFPYEAYHFYCVPPNARFAEQPYSVCDPYSNPQPQELMQLLPHPEWAPHGYPSSKGQGWVGQPTSWTLDVGGLSERLYFYQDPGTIPARRSWPSLDVGTEIYISGQDEVAEWIVSDFDVLIPKASAS